MIPTQKEIEKPFLEYLALRNTEVQISEVIKELGDANHFNLSDEELKQLLPSGKFFTFDNRVRWVQCSLKKRELIDSPKYGYVKITANGEKALKQAGKGLLFANQQNTAAAPRPQNNVVPVQQDECSPVEEIENSLNEFNENLKSELLELVRQSEPRLLEEIMLTLLEKMGFGHGKVTGGTGDGGIDGYVVDKLGLNLIVYQAKCYAKDNKIDFKEISSFVGAMKLKNAIRGVFVTTSDFTQRAKSFTSNEPNLVLINGERLASLMLENGVGVIERSKYIIKDVDENFFHLADG